MSQILIFPSDLCHPPVLTEISLVCDERTHIPGGIQDFLRSFIEVRREGAPSPSVDSCHAQNTLLQNAILAGRRSPHSLGQDQDLESGWRKNLQWVMFWSAWSRIADPQRAFREGQRFPRHTTWPPGLCQDSFWRAQQPMDSGGLGCSWCTVPLLGRITCQGWSNHDAPQEFCRRHNAAVWRCFCTFTQIKESKTRDVRDTAIMPLVLGGLGPRNATRTSKPARWASCTDCLSMVQRRHPHVAAALVTELEGSPTSPFLQAAFPAQSRVEIPLHMASDLH